MNKKQDCQTKYAVQYSQAKNFLHRFKPINTQKCFREFVGERFANFTIRTKATSSKFYRDKKLTSKFSHSLLILKYYHKSHFY